MKLNDFVSCTHDEKNYKYLKLPNGELVWGSSKIADGYNSSEAIQAVKDGDIEKVERLLIDGASPDSHSSIKEKYWEYADYSSGVSEYRHYTLLCYAIANEDEEMVEVLLDHGANPLLSVSVNGDSLSTNPFVMAKQVGGRIFKLVSEYAEETENNEREEEKRAENYKRMVKESGFDVDAIVGIVNRLWWANEVAKRIENDDFGSAFIYAKVNPNVPYLSSPYSRVRKILVQYDKTHSEEDNAKVVLYSKQYGNNIKEAAAVANKILSFYDKIETYSDYWEERITNLRVEVEKCQKNRDYGRRYSNSLTAIRFYDDVDDYVAQAEHILDAVEALEEAAAKSVIELWGS